MRGRWRKSERTANDRGRGKIGPTLGGKLKSDAKFFWNHRFGGFGVRVWFGSDSACDDDDKEKEDEDEEEEEEKNEKIEVKI